MTLKKRNEIALNQVSKPDVAMSATTIDKDHCRKKPNMKICEINLELNVQKENRNGRIHYCFLLESETAL